MLGRSGCYARQVIKPLAFQNQNQDRDPPGVGASWDTFGNRDRRWSRGLDRALESVPYSPYNWLDVHYVHPATPTETRATSSFAAIPSHPSTHSHSLMRQMIYAAGATSLTQPHYAATLLSAVPASSAMPSQSRLPAAGLVTGHCTVPVSSVSRRRSVILAVGPSVLNLGLFFLDFTIIASLSTMLVWTSCPRPLLPPT